MVTNFTELNRKRPNGQYDLINFSFTPIVHDASDMGIMDTPEDMAYIIKTLNHMCNIQSKCSILLILFIKYRLLDSK